MEALKLVLLRAELVRALQVLSTNRRRRFTSVLPIWLSYGDGELRLREERGGIVAALPAAGSWPAAGATVNLFALRGAAEAASADEVELIASANAVLVLTARGYVALDLLGFGPEKAIQLPGPQLDRHSDLPLFRWRGRTGV